MHPLLNRHPPLTYCRSTLLNTVISKNKNLGVKEQVYKVNKIHQNYSMSVGVNKFMYIRVVNYSIYTSTVRVVIQFS